MKLCSGCSRHYWDTEACCPFCGPESWGGTSTAATVLGVTLAAGVALFSCGSGNKGDTTDDNGGSYYAGPTTTEYGSTTDAGGSYYAGPTTTEFTTSGQSESSGSSTTSGADSTTVGPDPTTDDNGGSYYAGPTTTDFGSSTGGSSGSSTGMG